MRIDMTVKNTTIFCNIQGVSVHTNVSANYMFRPLLVSQTPTWHTSTIKEPLLYNSTPAAATGCNLEWPHGHNSGPFWHPATPTTTNIQCRNPEPLRTLTSLSIMEKYVTTD